MTSGYTMKKAFDPPMHHDTNIRVYNTPYICIMVRYLGTSKAFSMVYMYTVTVILFTHAVVSS